MRIDRSSAFRRARLGLTLGTLTVLVVVSAASAFTRPGTTERISRTYDGSVADGSSTDPKLSADGRVVVFTSTASKIVPGDVNNQGDVFVHDRATGETTFAAASADGTPPRFRTLEGTVSADGRFVVFYSLGRQRPEDPGTGLVYLKDLRTGELELISVADDESPPDGPSFLSNTMNIISDDNRYVIFMSRATNLVPGFTPTITGYHIYVRDRVEGRTELVSIGADGEPSTENNQTPAISGDGSVVAWETRAPLTPDETGGAMSVYARDLEAETTELISVTYDGQSANANSWRPRLSADGRFVTFETAAWNLVPRDIVSCCHSDVFVRDRLTDRTEKISLTSAGELANGNGYRASMSADGRYVAFWSDGPNMVPEGKPAMPDVYVRDVVTGRTELVSIAADGGFGNNSSQVPGISADGQVVAWFGWASNLTNDHDGTAFQHVHLRERGPTLGPYGVDVSLQEGSVEVSGAAAFAGDVVSEAADPIDDAGPLAFDLGTDLTAASVSWRPEDRDLLLRWRVTNIPFVADAPDVTYGLSFTAGERRYEVRAQGRELPNTSVNGIFVLYECLPVCVPLSDLRGGYGTAGAEVHAAVPMDLLDNAASIGHVDVYTAPAQGNAAAAVTYDTMALPDTELPSPVVRVGIAEPGAQPADAETVPLADGRFSTALDVSDLSSGQYDVVVTACLDECASDRYPLRIGPDTDPTTTPTSDRTEDPVPDVSTIAFTDRSAAAGQYSDATSFEAALADSAGDPIAGAEVSFELTGAESTRTFTTTTDGDGVAAVAPTLEEKPGPHQLTVRFPGDDSHEASSDTTAFVVEKEDTNLVLSVAGNGNNRTVEARLSDGDTPSGGIAARSITFYADGDLIGSSSTNGDGVASLKPPPRYRGGKHDFEARFESDDFYRASVDRTET